MVRCGKPPRMTQTRSAMRSIVTAVGPRPTSCCPGFRSDTTRCIPCGPMHQVVLLLSFLLGAGGAPAPDEPLPHSAAPFAERLTAVSRDLRADTDDWLATDPDAAALPPRELQLRALYQQRSIRRMARGRRFARAVLPRLPGWLRADARAEVAALHGLFRLSPPARSTKRFKVQAPLPPGRLLGFYRADERRFGVRWQVL